MYQSHSQPEKLNENMTRFDSRRYLKDRFEPSHVEKSASLVARPNENEAQSITCSECLEAGDIMSREEKNNVQNRIRNVQLETEIF
jgi:hypothetical protein